MKTIQIAFFKGAYGNFIDKAICFFTKGPYSHAEIVFEDGRCWSSSKQDGGVRFKQIIFDKNFNQDHWDFMALPVRDDQYAEILAFCKANVGKRYDWLGALSFVLPVRQDRKRLFCSEAIVRAFHSAHLLGHIKPYRVNPSRLWKLVLHWALHGGCKTNQNYQQAEL